MEILERIFHNRNMKKRIGEVRTIGYDYQEKIKTYTTEEFMNKVKENNIDTTNYRLSNNDKAYVRFEEKNGADVMYSYHLNKYGNLVCFKDLVTSAELDVYHNGKVYKTGEFMHPEYAYAFENDIMWYAYRVTSAIRIRKITPDSTDMIVCEEEDTNRDVEKYLIDYLLGGKAS